MEEEVSNVKCDSTHECPSRHTCCKLSSGQWGCCPLPSAVCCDDKVHCCPEGTTCSVSTGKCNKGDISLPWFEKVPSISTVEEVSNVKCDATHECPTKHTCCKLSSGQWGCCPLPNAVCCNDHVHCCPEGTTCSVSTGKCNKGDISLPWFEKSPAITMEEEVSNVQCDSTHECPSKHTCCKLSSGQWGCCPLPSAVCCDDKVHCCPEGTTCEVSSGKCKKKDCSMPWFEKVPSISTVQEVSNVKCDATHECPTKHTCCKLASGQWGCCPLPSAVCCNDHVHCCPEGTTCSVSTGKCERGDISFPWFEKKAAISVEETSNIKCDATHECKSTDTCCKLKSGQWGCCPLPKAVCCSDQVHCCPGGTTCSAGKCKRGDVSIPWFEKKAALTVQVTVEKTPCPGGKQECPTNHTCCQRGTTPYTWGCCDFPTAECCPDRKTCCPKGYHCDPSRSTCYKSESDEIVEAKQLIIPDTVQSEVGNVVCPGGQYQCPDKTTCCRGPTGTFGCCPMSEAVCCEDGVHCCPQGQVCDPSSAICKGPSGQLQWLDKLLAKQVQVKDIKCGSSTSTCGDTETCCKMASGQWGCCPMPKAVCCEDHLHCCPRGYKCDMPTSTCIRGDDVFPMAKKRPADIFTKS
ncbi:GRN [Branchiostoma lanceolatum]|uniref:GRN protein n=1 Tax=Branchiostoma lanceolatum TaxID=7740 RepID=A0A8J9VJN9_BRALA|nr:GRN [Branchiostoma lanceolatum]